VVLLSLRDADLSTAAIQYCALPRYRWDGPEFPGTADNEERHQGHFASRQSLELCMRGLRCPQNANS